MGHPSIMVRRFPGGSRMCTNWLNLRPVSEHSGGEGRQRRRRFMRTLDPQETSAGLKSRTAASR
jgi:hypothetical protein